MKKKLQDILSRYEKKLGRNLGYSDEYYSGEKFSKQYETFRKEALEKKVTRYETWCNFAEKFIKLKVSEKDKEKIERAIDDAHLNIGVNGALSFAVLVGILVLLFGALLLGLSFLFGHGLLTLSICFLIFLYSRINTQRSFSALAPSKAIFIIN